MIPQRNYNISIEDLKSKIPEYSSDWSKFDERDIGSALLQILSANEHVVDYYVRFYLDNLYLPTNEIRAKEQIYELLNYKPASKRSSVLSMRVDWTGCGPDQFIKIPKYTRVKVTTDGIDYNFLVTKDYLFQQNVSSITMNIILGELVDLTFPVNEIESNKIFITEDEIDFESVVFQIDDTIWTQVKNIYYQKDPGTKYSVHKEESGTYIYLPDNWKRDSVPSDISEIKIQAVKVQSQFNIYTQDCIQISFEDSILDADGNDVTDSFKIYPIDSSSEISSYIVSSERIITLEDYEVQALAYPGVAIAKAYDWSYYDTSLEINRPDYVKLVVAGDNGLLNNYIKGGLKQYLKSISLSDIDLEIIDPILKQINLILKLNIGSYYGTPYQAEIYQSIRNAIENYLSIGNLPIGKPLDLSALTARIIRSDTRIRYAEISFNGSYTFGPRDLPVLGTLTTFFNVISVPNYDFVTGEDKSFIERIGNESGIITEYVNLETDRIVEDSAVSEEYRTDAEFVSVEINETEDNIAELNQDMKDNEVIKDDINSIEITDEDSGNIDDISIIS